MARRYRFEADGYVHGSKVKSDKASKKKDRIEEMGAGTLIKNYLCKGRKSACVKTGACYLLDDCRYGQRYLKIMRELAKHEE